MSIQFGCQSVLTNYESSLVFAMDPANPACFAGPPTTNDSGSGMSIYNNVPSHVTASLSLTDPIWYFRGAPVYKQVLTPTTSTGVSYLTGGNNPGIGVYTAGGGYLANTYTGHSIFFKPMFQLSSNGIYTHYSNIAGWQSSTTFEYIGDGWYRAWTTWFDTVARNDSKYWAINPAAATQDRSLVCYWAGPFKETQPQNSLSVSNPLSVNPYTLVSRPASPKGLTGLQAPTDSKLYHGGILDLSGKGNGMEILGTIFYNSDGGGSLVFNGSNTYLRTIDNAIGSSSAEFTLEAWSQTATASGYQTVIGTETTLRQIGFLNNSVVYGGNGGGGNILRTTFSGSVSTNTWYHLVMTYDGLTARCYVDGTLRDTNTIGALSGYPGPGRSIIGSYAYSSASERLNGKVGIARIYNRALDATEVANNYNSTRSRYAK